MNSNELNLEKLMEAINKMGIAVDDKKSYEERIAKELAVIKECKIEDGFIILCDLFNWAQSKNILIQSVRGVGSSSLVLYLLGATLVDPIKHNLVFERYINKELKMSPYFSINISKSHMDDLRTYVQETYGLDKVLIIPKRIGKDVLNEIYLFNTSIKDKYDGSGRVNSWLIDDAVARFDVWNSEVVSVIDETVKQVRNTIDKDFNIENIPLDDPKTYELIASGDTKKVFMLDDSKMIKYLKKLKPDCFEDIVAINVLFRPGPIEAGFMDVLIDRKHGLETVEYPFKELEQIMKETYGILIYQEQLQMIVNKVAGYTLEKGDVLRRTMGKRQLSKIDEERFLFIEAAKKNGFDLEKSTELFDLMTEHSQYLFSKAHAVSCSLLGYRTAYLKTHYNKEYMSVV